MMKSSILIISYLMVFNIGCQVAQENNYEINSDQTRIVKDIIDAVNERDVEKYVAGFAENTQVFVDSELKVDRRQALAVNRANHFKNHPQVRSEIQHLVEIDNRVVLHDKVWLDESDNIGQDIVEIFTFTNGKISKVDVIQPKELFSN